MVRMYLEKKYPKAIKREWIAEFTLKLCKRAVYPQDKEDILLSFFGPSAGVYAMSQRVIENIFRPYSPMNYDIEMVVAENRGKAQKPFYPFIFRKNNVLKFLNKSYVEEMSDIIDEAKACKGKYAANQKVTSRELAKHCLRLAQIDTIFRSGRATPWLGITGEEDVKDLCTLFKLFLRQKWHKNRRVVVLNPTFGKASEIVHGADADLVLDDILIDIKCTRHRQISREAFNQILGYYILYRIGGIENVPSRHKINHLGIYFARHAELISFSVNEFIPEKKLPEISDMFINMAEKYCKA